VFDITLQPPLITLSSPSACTSSLQLVSTPVDILPLDDSSSNNMTSPPVPPASRPNYIPTTDAPGPSSAIPPPCLRCSQRPRNNRIVFVRRPGFSQPALPTSRAPLCVLAIVFRVSRSGFVRIHRIPILRVLVVVLLWYYGSFLRCWLMSGNSGEPSAVMLYAQRLH